MINLILKNASHLEDYIDQLKQKFPNKIYVTIREIKGVDSSRKEYFARLGNFAESLGYNKSEMHEFVKENILPAITKHKEFIQHENGLNSTSTTSLNEAGYTKLIQSLEDYIFNNVDKVL